VRTDYLVKRVGTFVLILWLASTVNFFRPNGRCFPGTTVTTTGPPSWITRTVVLIGLRSQGQAQRFHGNTTVRTVADAHTFDFVVVGSGFGGSVAACRLAEKGYSVAVLEMGKRWTAKDFPKTTWNLRRWIWRPVSGRPRRRSPRTTRPRRGQPSGRSWRGDHFHPSG